MQIVAKYSLKNGEAYIKKRFPLELREIENVLHAVNANECRKKVSKEKTMLGKMLYSPTLLNKKFKESFYSFGWKTIREKCQYSDSFYVAGYDSGNPSRGAYREMDFIKNKLGVEVQFGKYSFMVYNVAAKMTIFRNLGHIDAGVEIVPVKKLAKHMSTGVSYFEQFQWDLQTRGSADIDTPVLGLGIDV